MIHLVLPYGTGHGWGVCGMNLVVELARLAPVRHLVHDLSPAEVGDELWWHALRPHRTSADVWARYAAGELPRVDGPLLTAVGNHELRPIGPPLAGRPTIGYTFFEEYPPDEAIAFARDHYDVLVAGSRWGEEALRERGLERVATVVQGVDPALFNPAGAEKRLFPDRFMVFSGGKMELRKGQDLVIRAVAVLQQRHPDVWLVTAWSNPWRSTLDTMASAPGLRWPAPFTGTQEDLVRRLLAANGADPERAIVLPARPNALMPAVYKRCDLGLFPNRCEGGTNLVLMEHMACGRPAIATDATGHRDVLLDGAAIPLRGGQEAVIVRDGREIARWHEPDLDEVVERLEWAYGHRDELAAIGRRAGEAMAVFTWRRAAEAFLALLRPA